MNLRHIVFGSAFGFVLSRTGATRFDAIFGMFTLSDLQMIGVIGTAIVLLALGFSAFRTGLVNVRGGVPAALAPKPLTKGLITGALLFGAGWAVTGTCPGTALAQIGEGHLSGLFTFAGVLMGAALQQRRTSAHIQHQPRRWVSALRTSPRPQQANAT